MVFPCWSMSRSWAGVGGVGTILTRGRGANFTQSFFLNTSFKSIQVCIHLFSKCGSGYVLISNRLF